MKPPPTYTINRRGFTLLEALLASVLLASVIVSITTPFTAGAWQTLQDRKSTIAVALAQEMMEEILSICNQPQMTVDQGVVPRPTFTTPLHYDNYIENDGAIRNSRGSIITDPLASGLSRHVNVEYVTVANQRAEDHQAFISISVVVKQYGQPAVSLTRLVYTGLGAD